MNDHKMTRGGIAFGPALNLKEQAEQILRDAQEAGRIAAKQPSLAALLAASERREKALREALRELIDCLDITAVAMTRDTPRTVVALKVARALADDGDAK